MRMKNIVKGVALLMGASLMTTFLAGCNKNNESAITESSAATVIITEMKSPVATSIETTEEPDFERIKKIFAPNDEAMLIIKLHDASYDPGAEINAIYTFSDSLKKIVSTDDFLSKDHAYTIIDGKLIREELPDETTDYNYDDAGRIVEEQTCLDNGYPCKSHEYIYDGDHLVKEVVTHFSYDESEWFTTAIITTEYSYYDDGSLKTIHSTFDDIEESGWFNITSDESEYYYEDGLLVKEIESIEYTNGDREDNEYVSSYDENGNLIKYEKNYTGIPLYKPTIECWEYTYDENGFVTHFSYRAGYETANDETYEGDYEYEIGDQLKRSLTINDGRTEYYMEYVYDEKGLILSVDTSNDVIPGMHVEKSVFEYEFDDKGRCTDSIKKSSGGTLLNTTKYYYN